MALKIKMVNTKSIALVSILLLLSMGLAAPVFAGTAQIGIYPPYPTKNATGVFTADAKQLTENIHVLLVMSETSYLALTGTATVAWTAGNGGSAGSVPVTEWEGPISDGKIPEDDVIAPYSIKTGDGYTASSCRSHLGITTGEDLYYAWVPVATMKLYTQLVTITITADSGDSTNTLIYLVGQTDDAKTNEFDVRVPNTNGALFVVPEYPIGALAAVGACFVALAVVKFKKSRN